MVGALELMSFVSSLDTVPAHEARRRPVGRDSLDQPAPGILGRQRDTLGLPGFDRQRIQPVRLPAVVEPVQHPEMVSVDVDAFRDIGEVVEGHDADVMALYFKSNDIALAAINEAKS